jgi:hypothetical protein
MRVIPFFRPPAIKCGMTGKICYDKKTAVSKINFRRKFGAILRVYSCDWCGKWHLSKHTKDGDKYEQYEKT